MFRSIASIILIFASIVPGRATESDANLQDTLDGMKITHRELHRMICFANMEILGRRSDGEATTYSTVVKSARFDEKFYVEKSSTPPGIAMIQLAFNGDVFKSWNTIGYQFPGGAGRFHNQMRKNPGKEADSVLRIHQAAEFGNWALLHMPNDPKPIHEMLASEIGSVKAGPVQGGIQTIVAHLKTGDYELKVDRNKGCLITEGKVTRKRSLGQLAGPYWDGFDGKSFSFKILSTQQIDGLWVPVRAEADESREPHGRPVSTTHYSMKLDNVKRFKSEPPFEIFNFEFPEGARLKDAVSGDQYTAGKKGALLPFKN